MFVPHASEIWTKSDGLNLTTRNFELFDKIKSKKTKEKKNDFLKTIFWQSIAAILEDVSVAETIV